MPPTTAERIKQLRESIVEHCEPHEYPETEIAVRCNELLSAAQKESPDLLGNFAPIEEHPHSGITAATMAVMLDQMLVALGGAEPMPRSGKAPGWINWMTQEW